MFYVKNQSMFLFIFNFLPIDQASLAFNGSAGAPLVGVFILGACFTSSNWVVSMIFIYLHKSPSFEAERNKRLIIKL